MSPVQPKLKRHPARRHLLKLYGAERGWTMRGRFMLRMKRRRETRREVARERRWIEEFDRLWREEIEKGGAVVRGEGLWGGAVAVFRGTDEGCAR